MRQNLFLTTLFVLVFQTVFSQTPSLDTSFGINGKVVTPMSSGIDRIWNFEIQSDGKIVTCGGYNNSGCALVRYNADGSLDNSFGTIGRVIPVLPTFAAGTEPCVKIQPDGKILLLFTSGTSLASSNFILCRYNANGTLDNSFGNNGITTTDFNADGDFVKKMLVQDDGKILIAGYVTGVPFNNCALARYNANGLIDTTFGDNGKVQLNIGGNSMDAQNSIDIPEDIRIQNDGKIVIGGYTDASSDFQKFNFFLVRLNENGSLDASFGYGGKVITDFGDDNQALASLQLLRDGKIIAVGCYFADAYFNAKILLSRYNTDGSLDLSYGTNGFTITNFDSVDATLYGFITSSWLLSDQKILLSGFKFDGSQRDYFTARYSDNGLLDSTYGDNGFFTTDFNGADDDAHDIKLQQDGKMIVAGSTETNNLSLEFSLLRYDYENLSNQEILNEGFSVYPNPFSESIIIECKDANLTNSNVELFDINGRKLSEFKLDGISNSIPINKNLSKGNYLLKITNEGKSETVKIIKQ